MGRRDRYHDHVRQALENSGWHITDDPYKLGEGMAQYEIDIGAEQLFAAEKGPEKIAVEVKSFVHGSKVNEFHRAIGQYTNYQTALDWLEPNRKLFLAVPQVAYLSFFQERLVVGTLQRINVKLLVYEPDDRSIITWKSYNSTEK